LTVIDGAKCLTEADFYDEVSSRLDFPDYFGRNWDAFNDSFPESLFNPEKPKHIITIVNANQLLMNAIESDLFNMLDIMKDWIPKVSVEEDEEETSVLVKVLFVVENIQASKITEIMKKHSFPYKDFFLNSAMPQ
jgi:RNAse (barnase) inhibitor barstar